MTSCEVIAQGEAWQAVAAASGLDRVVIEESLRRAAGSGTFEWVFVRTGPCPMEVHAGRLLASGAIKVVGEEPLGHLAVRRYRVAPWLLRERRVGEGGSPRRFQNRSKGARRRV